jgi:hypothetical protein
MKKGYKFLFLSIGLLTLGVGSYFIIKSRKIEDNGLSPEENIEQEDINVNEVVINDIVYPSGTYVNIRTSPYVNNGFISNLLGTVNSPNPVGSVLQIIISEGHTWYQVSLSDDILVYSGTNVQDYQGIGYVRSDVVTKII